MWNGPVGALCHTTVGKSGVAHMPELWYDVDRAHAQAKSRRDRYMIHPPGTMERPRRGDQAVDLNMNAVCTDSATAWVLPRAAFLQMRAIGAYARLSGQSPLGSGQGSGRVGEPWRHDTSTG